MIALSSLTCQAMPYFHILSHKGTFTKTLLNIKCVFWFSLQPLTEAFIVRQTERDIIINEHTPSCKLADILVSYSLKLNFLYRRLTISQVLIIKKFFHWEPSRSMLKNTTTDTETEQSR